MGSSGGGGSSAGMMALMGQGTPMPNLPVAGSAGAVNPQEYGKFQNFLPDIKAEGVNDMATGLRPDMFKYRSPSGVVAEGSGGSGAGGGSDQGLRDMLAQLLAGGGGGGGGGGMTWMPNAASSGSPTDGPSMSDIRGGSWQPTGGGAIGSMGMGGGGGGMFGGRGGIPAPSVQARGTPNAIGGIDNSSAGGTPAGYRMQPWMQGLPHWQGSGAAGDLTNGGTNLPTDWRAKDAAAAAAAAAAKTGT